MIFRYQYLDDLYVHVNPATDAVILVTLEGLRFYIVPWSNQCAVVTDPVTFVRCAYVFSSPPYESCMLLKDTGQLRTVAGHRSCNTNRHHRKSFFYPIQDSNKGMINLAKGTCYVCDK